ncbi:hypothetical protein IKL45_02570 [Candidatus Saccharibacteria bacterium]|nr:hypothetical protein [Candidatus Saccharibacteria bacterium]MBR6122041.1 hypothetical protein [Candidatus Saccharibacteria bacterium]
MSKKLIAGAGVVASFAIALAPLATFAIDEADKHTDRLNVTVTPSCTFGTATTNPVTKGISHNSTGTDKAEWNTTTSPAVDSDGTGADLTANPISDSYTNKSLHIADYTTVAGKVSTAFAETHLTVICNSSTGYTLKANAANLNIASYDADTNNYSIPVSATATAAQSGYNFGVGSTAKATDAVIDATTVTATGLTKIAHNPKESLETGDVYDITYNLGVQASQKAGTYTGDIVYTLYQGQES